MADSQTAASLSPRNLAAIRSGNYTPAQLHECLSDIIGSVNNIGPQANAAPVGSYPQPQPHSKLSVLGGNGIFDIAMTDESPQYRGNENFVDYSETADFSDFHTIHVGASNNHRVNLGKKALHFRSYPSYPTTGPATPIYHPTVVDGSAPDEPPMQANQGSGTGTQGWGAQPYNTDNPPIRG